MTCIQWFAVPVMRATLAVELPGVGDSARECRVCCTGPANSRVAPPHAPAAVARYFRSIQLSGPFGLFSTRVNVHYPEIRPYIVGRG